MLFQIKSYIFFLWKSKNEHAVHSPFVYQLLTQCFYDTKQKPEYQLLLEYRKELLQNKNSIEVTDFGSGSKVFKTNRRPINKIAKIASISPKRAQLLFRISSYFQYNQILEIGTSLGIATSALAYGNSKSKITSLEGCPNTQAIAKEKLQKNFDSIEFINCEFSQFINLQNLADKHYDLIYFDGNHSKQATLAYFNQLLVTKNNNSVWIFDDIHLSPQMQMAWQSIIKNPEVSVSIDTYQWGFVFFRKEQPKQHFVIRV